MPSSRRTSLPRHNSSNRSTSNLPFVPSANKETYKDLLIFEERLKQNSERLQRQRIKYEGILLLLLLLLNFISTHLFLSSPLSSAFLFSLILVTILLAYKSFLAVSPVSSHPNFNQLSLNPFSSNSSLDSVSRSTRSFIISTLALFSWPSPLSFSSSPQACTPNRLLMPTS